LDKELIAVLGAAFFPVGFFIAVLSHLLLRVFFFVATRNWSEVSLKQEAFGRIWRLLGIEGQPDRKLEYYASASFDHGIIAKAESGVHEWIMRYWSGYLMSAHSAVALMLAHLAACILNSQRTFASRHHNEQSYGWWMTTLILGTLLILNGVLAWFRCTRMIEFQSSRPEYLNRQAILPSEPLSQT
jgi:hypothetical protein